MAVELEAMGGESDLGDGEERLARDAQRFLIGTVVRIDAALAVA
jgi:hypothetical protein